MVLPGEAGEAIVTVDQSEPQGLVKSDGKLEVANEDLDDQLLGGIDVARAGRGIRRSTLSRQGIRPSSHEIDAVPPAAGSPRFCVPRPPASRYATAATDWKCCFSPAIPAPPMLPGAYAFPGRRRGTRLARVGQMERRSPSGSPHCSRHSRRQGSSSPGVPTGAPVTAAELGAARLPALRARSREDAAAFRAFLLDEGCRLATDRMIYYVRWVTPEERPLRYDARFFLALAPPGGGDSPLIPDGRETIACDWIQPAAALARARTSGVPLPVPTREVLRSLVNSSDTVTLVAAARHREVKVVRPRIVLENGRE